MPGSTSYGYHTKAYPYDANFYDFAVNMWTESKQLKANEDLLISNKAYDAMSLSVSQEKFRKLSNGAASTWTKISNSTWYNSFNTLCGARCNMLTFELVDSSSKPTVNSFLYRLNQSASFNSTLEKV